MDYRGVLVVIVASGCLFSCGRPSPEVPGLSDGRKQADSVAAPRGADDSEGLVEVVVQTELGEPVSGALVEMWATSWHLIGRAPEIPEGLAVTSEDVEHLTLDVTWRNAAATKRSGELGNVAFEAPAHRLTFVASHPRFGTSGKHRVDPGLGAFNDSLDQMITRMERVQGTWQSTARFSERLTLTLRDQSTLTGTVVDEKGRPAAGALVVFDGLRSEEHLAPRVPRPVVATRNGSFEAKLDAPGNGHVSAILDGMRTASYFVVFRSGEQVEATLRFGVESLIGTVTGPSGAPVKGAKVVVRCGYRARHDLVTSGDGRFTAELTAGEGPWSITATASGLVQSVPVRVKGDGTGQVGRVDVPMIAAGRITGTVVSASGDAVARACVSATPERSGAEGTFLMVEEPAVEPGFYFTDQDGHFVLEPVHPGLKYTVTVDHEGEVGSRLPGIRGDRSDLRVQLNVLSHRPTVPLNRR